MFSFAPFIPLVLATSGPNVIVAEDGWFDVVIIYDDKSVRGHANAQIALMRAAKKYCGKKSHAVSEGKLTLNDAPPLRGNRPSLELIERYRCLPKE